MASSILQTNEEKALTHRRPYKQVKQSEPNRRLKKKMRRQAIFTLIAPPLWLSLVLLGSGARIERAYTSSAAQKDPAQSAPATPAPQSPEREVKDTAWDPAWPPLPGRGKPAKPIKEVQAMYAFAARHPEVLQYAPCFCGCEKLGHKSVLDCFIKGRDTNGGPQWDDMGFT
jgi:uncharacterized protein with PCYCGC motif